MNTPIIVVGGGPAGATAALTLARAGIPCRLLERSTGPDDKVCGEFLSTEAIAFLDGLGFPWQTVDAVPIRQIRLEHRGWTGTFRLPFDACAVGRRILDEWLLRTAAQSGATLERGVHVRNITRSDQGFLLETESNFLATKLLVLASGKHAVAVFHPRENRGAQSLIGWKMNFHHVGQRLRADFDDTLALVFFRGGYGGVVRTGKDILTVSLLVQSAVFRDHRSVRLGFLWALADECPLLRTVLEEAEPLWPQPKTISNLPYGHCDRVAQPGLFTVGDQFAVLPSFTGTGISFAMTSGRLAATHIAGSVNGQRASERRYVEAARNSAAMVLRHAMSLHHLLQRPGFATLALMAANWFPPLLSFVARRTRLNLPPRERDAV